MENNNLTAKAINEGIALSTFVPYMAIYKTHTTTAHTGYNWKSIPQAAINAVRLDIINGKTVSLSIGYNC